MQSPESSPVRARKLVVAALITRGEGRADRAHEVLISQRREDFRDDTDAITHIAIGSQIRSTSARDS